MSEEPFPICHAPKSATDHSPLCGRVGPDVNKAGDHYTATAAFGKSARVNCPRCKELLEAEPTQES